MARDPSHESTTSVQTEPAENNNSNSTDDSYLTPMMSPIEAASALPLFGRRPAQITTTLSGNLPYPVIDSPDTEPLPILTPRIAFRNGLGISTQDDGDMTAADIQRPKANENS